MHDAILSSALSHACMGMPLLTCALPTRSPPTNSPSVLSHGAPGCALEPPPSGSYLYLALTADKKLTILLPMPEWPLEGGRARSDGDERIVKR